MSATGRGAERVSFDVYNTEQRDCLRICNELLEIPNGVRILEPSAGDGNWVHALRAFRPSAHIEAVEIRKSRIEVLRERGANMAWHADFLQWKNHDPAAMGLRMPDRPLFDWAVGNPPYAEWTGRYNDKGEPIVRECVGRHVIAAMRALRPGGRLAFLLRLGWYAPAKGNGLVVRDELLARYPPLRVTVLRERPSFTKDGKTDAATYAVFQWEKGWSGDTTLDKF